MACRGQATARNKRRRPRYPLGTRPSLRRVSRRRTDVITKSLNAPPFPIALLGVLLASTVSCGRAARPATAPSEDSLATVQLALTEPPAGIACVVVTIATDRQERRAFDVQTGVDASYALHRLPVGVVVFTVDAYREACAALA